MIENVTYRQVASVEGVNDERFVADVDDTGDSVAGVEGGRSSGIVLHRAVVVAVLDLLNRVALSLKTREV
jgi:hypothetical protein